ncbi:MAG: formate/nitrite transporter family protein, partial [Phycisphaerae bacterium]|nr:formate/nitrite transporter family protein [Phycisphaerae bacterium]
MTHNQDDAKQQEREEDEIYEKSAASARVVYKAVEIEGEEELERSTSALAWSGVAAGLSMGFSLVTEGLLRSHLPDAPWRPLIAKFGYTVGFLIVVLGRQQLFTENTLTPIIPFLHRPTKKKFVNVMRLWLVVLITNLVAAGAFAYVLAKSPAFDPEIKKVFLEIGKESFTHDAVTVLVRGVFAGWLIALMVWLLPVAETARVGVIIIITYIVGLGQLTHIIAGSVETIYVVACGEATWSQYIFGYMFPTLIGNVLGGTALVAAINHAQ